MEDLASEFREDFLEAVKVLEDFSSSDNALREAMREVRGRIDSKTYVCAPHFWADLRESLRAVERKREESSAKSKAQQVLKQVARLEVKFWAKESVGMLRELDAESRLERMRDWILTFDASEGAGDQSSGPAVLYQVLSDVSLQKDLEPQQRDSLLTAVRENLHKFPVEMQAVLERVGSLQGGGGPPQVLSDWRRRNQPTSQEQAPSGGSTRLSFVPAPKAVPALPQPPGPIAAAVPGAPPLPGAQPTPHGVAAEVAPLPARQEEEAAEDEEQAAAREPFDMSSVDPAVLERARRAVVAALDANGGECQRHHVRTLLKQAGLEKMPVAALGPAVFASATEVFCRKPGTPLPPAAQAPARGSPVPEELRRQMVVLVREAGGRLVLGQLAEALQWHQGSIRHAMHGPIKKAIAQVPELFYEPKRVLSMERARLCLAALGELEEEPAEQPPDAAATVAVPYIADPFAELLSTVHAWLEREEGVLSQDAVLPLAKAMGFKLRSVIAGLSRSVFWSHPEAECEILLRTPAGAAQHPRPLPKVYLHEQVHQKLLEQIRGMGSKAKYDKLAGALGWNARSELRKAYGQLRVVLSGLREVFFDPSRLYLKRALDGIVEWPVNRDGRLGPQAEEAPVLQHWTRAVDDPRLAGDPEWLGVKRQVIGALMRRGGACEAEALRPLLQPVEGVELEQLLEPGSAHDLTELLLWPRDVVYCRRPEAAAAAAAEAPDVPISQEARLALADVVRRQGPLKVEELRGALEAGGVSDAEALIAALPQVPELLFAPGVVLLRHVAEGAALLAAEAPPAVELPGASTAGAAAAQPEAAAAAEAPKVEADADPKGEPAAAESGARFFSFSEFAPAAEGTSEAAQAEDEPPRPDAKAARPADLDAAPVAAKRPRIGGAAEAPADTGASWSEEAPPWATEGAAVTLREGGQEAIVLRARGPHCTVQLLSGEGVGEERELATPMLLPAQPSVGVSVRVVAGARSGCQGKLVGLAGADGVVQIAGMSYETLPMSHLAVLAS